MIRTIRKETRKFDIRRKRHGIVKAWQKTNPYAQAGFALVASAGIVFSTAVAVVGGYEVFKAYNNYMDNKETPVVEQYKPTPSRDNGVFDKRLGDLNRLLD